MSADKRVVVTGAEGPVAAAVEKALRKLNVKVVALVRGDDPLEPIRGAEAVVVLDAARPLGMPVDYEVALGAVGQAVRGSPVKRVVSVTLCQPNERIRKRFGEAAEAAERDFAAAGIELIRIRFGIVVGTPGSDGPIDDVLFARGDKLWAPKPGTQEIRPLLVDDLASVVAAATQDGAHDDVVIVEGPRQTSVDELMRTVNEADVRISHFGRLRQAIDFVSSIGGVARVLPASNLLLREGDPPAGALGVHLRPLEEVWSPTAVLERRQRRKRARHTRRYRATVWSSLVAFSFALLGLGAAAIGAVDLLSLPTLGARLVSVTILLAGMFIVVGGLSLFWTSWPGRYALAFLAGVAAALLLVALLVASIVNGDTPELSFLWAALGAGVLIGCRALWQRGRLMVEDFMRSVIKVSGSLIAAGVGVTLLQFLYSSVYAPTTATPLLNAKVSLDPGPGVGNTVRVDVAVEVENHSKGSVNLLGAVYRMDGAEVRPVAATGPPGSARPSRWVGPLLYDRPVSTHVRRAGRVLLDRGTLLPSGSYFEPGERIERRFVVYVPRRLDVASMTVDLAMARRRFRSFSFNSLELRPTSEGPVAIKVHEIDDPSWLHRLIRETRYLHVMHALGGSPPWDCGTSQLAAYIDNRWQTDLSDAGCADFERRKADHYGLTYTSATAEVQIAGTDAGRRRRLSAVSSSSR